MTGTSKCARLRFECRHWFERSPPGRIEFTKGCPRCGSHWCSGPVQTPSDSSSETHCSPRHSTPAQRSTSSSNKHYTWLGILLADAMRRSAAGGLEMWMINELEPNTRLRRYLARAQAWPDPDPNRALAKLGDLTFF